MAWFHDGIATGDSVVYEGNVKDIDMSICRGKTASIAIYTYHSSQNIHAE